MDWSSVFSNNELYEHIINESQHTETVDSINLFYDFLLQNVNYHTCLKVAIIWDFWDEYTQTAFVVSKVGEFHASRLLGAMDYWNIKLKQKAIEYDVRERSIARIVQQFERTYDLLDFEVLSIDEEHNDSAISKKVTVSINNTPVEILAQDNENFYNISSKGVANLCREEQ